MFECNACTGETGENGKPKCQRSVSVPRAGVLENIVMFEIPVLGRDERKRRRPPAGLSATKWIPKTQLTVAFLTDARLTNETSRVMNGPAGRALFSSLVRAGLAEDSRSNPISALRAFERSNPFK